MNAKHTPGPWHRNIRANGRYPVIFAGRNQHVATATQQTDPAETEANIDLVAAAPDLLEALREMVEVFTHHHADAQKALEQARASIAKATGGNL